jgi:two-component system cell cycle response regulator CtrA
MHVLQAGLDERTMDFLRANKILPHSTEEGDGAEEVVEWVLDGHYEAVIVDLDVTGWGIFFPRAFRERSQNVPVVGISRGTARLSWPEQRATFLENGGDDLLQGPANPRELAATLRAVSRRFKGSAVDMLAFPLNDNVLRIDRQTQRAYLNDFVVPLTPKEFTVLESLCVSNGRVLSKEGILRNLYATYEDEAEIKIVDVFICKVRRKLGAIASGGDAFVATSWGRGYELIYDRQTTPAPAASIAAE